MLFKTALLLGLAAAVPTEDLQARNVNCKAVNLVVQALKISPGASRYCSNVLGIKAVQTTQTVSTVKTVTTTKCTTPTVTQILTATSTSVSTTCFQPKRLGRAFKFAEPTDSPGHRRAAVPLQTSALQDTIRERALSCDDAPVNGFACSLIRSACNCLSLPTTPGTVTSTKTSFTTTTFTSLAKPKTVSKTTTTTVVEVQRIDTNNDPSNCGRCGHACSGSTPLCAYGNCVETCVPGQDFSSDLLNCGSCGYQCGDAQYYQCISGECIYVDQTAQFTGKR